jgi:hypothetical protein
MARLNVPQEFHASLAALIDASDEFIAGFVVAVRSTTPRLNPSRFADQVNDLFGSTELSVGTRAKLIDALFALSSLRFAHDVELEELVTDVSASILPDEAYGSHRRTVLESRLANLLECESLVLSSRGSTLQREHQHTLMESMILTDLRPVYAQDAKAIKAATIVHSLKLVYFDGPDLKEFFVALDDKDVADLKRSVLRAESKSETLKSLLLQAKVENLNGD